MNKVGKEEGKKGLTKRIDDNQWINKERNSEKKE